MEESLRNIIREEFERVMLNTFSEDEVTEAILKKHFIHTKNGNVYSPVKLDKGNITGVDSDCQHINITLEEIALIQSSEDRFKK
jgi:hypothetical protein